MAKQEKCKRVGLFMEEIYASVLIPVKNGGELLSDVIDAVLSQHVPWLYEVIVADSGSIDGTVDLVRRKGVQCISIPPNEFGHGKTRNLLASKAKGRFLVFLTQDAKPASSNWLQEIVNACDSDDEVAGAFGPHMAHPNARFVTKKELELHFASFGENNTKYKLEDHSRFEVDPGYRQLLHFFSNNNSCLRKSVWEEIPFSDVAFAEDQIWALNIIKRGYVKIYAAKAYVFHSHDFGVWETLQRNFDESRSFEVYFSYQVQPLLFKAMIGAIKLYVRDKRWLSDSGVAGFVYFKQTILCFLIEVARMAGQYLGTKHKLIPRVLASYLSRDERMRLSIGGMK